MSTEPSFSTSLTFLLADDDADDRELFTEAVALVDAAAKVETVDDGEKLMQRLKDSFSLPDFIFLDLNMPRKNGIECLREIRQYEFLKRIPVLIYTTSLNTRDVDQTFELGAYGFIQKPNSFEKIKEVVKKVLTSDFKEDMPVIKEKFIL